MDANCVAWRVRSPLRSLESRRHPRSLNPNASKTHLSGAVELGAVTSRTNRWAGRFAHRFTGTLIVSMTDRKRGQRSGLTVLHLKDMEHGGFYPLNQPSTITMAART